MPRIFFTNVNNFERSIRAETIRRMRNVFRKSAFLLDAQAEILQKAFASSAEFKALSGSLKGQFGFTDAEVANLNRILDLLVPGGHDITVKRVKTSGNNMALILDWVDFEKLKMHEYAEHALTRLDKDGNEIGVTDIVSWVQWLEEGVTIAGYQFFRPNRANIGFSRSGEGLMRVATGRPFSFEPTRVFERIAKLEAAGGAPFLKKGFGVVVTRLEGQK
jgi:hypothetical protein